MKLVKHQLFSKELSQRGATMIEFAIVIPLFLLVVMASIEFARFRLAKGVVDAGAQRAVDVASTIAGLNSEDDSAPGYQDALARIEGAANKISRSVLSNGESESTFKVTGNPIVTIPEPRFGEKRTDAMQRAPIVVEIPATYTPFFLPSVLPSIPFTGKAAGFREPIQRTSMPVPIDCRGLGLGSDGFWQDCPCSDSATVWDPSSRSCVCGDDFSNAGEGGVECLCSGSGSLNSSGDGCSCPDLDCPPGQTLDTDACECSCPPGSSYDGRSCVCDDPDKELIFSKFSSTGECGCRDSLKCINTGLVLDPDTCECVCSPTEEQACEASGGSLASDCSCSCPAPQMVPSSSSLCECAPGYDESQCGGLTEFNQETCLCECSQDAEDDCEDSGGSFNHSDCACHSCPSNKVIGSDGTCVCPRQSICHGVLVPDGNCGCSCPVNFELAPNGSCVQAGCLRPACTLNKDGVTCFCEE